MKNPFKNMGLTVLLAAGYVAGVEVVHAEEPPSAQPKQENPITAEALPGKMGYYYGYSFGRMLRDGGTSDVDTETLVQGLLDALSQNPPALSQAERQQIYEEIRQRQEVAQAEKQRAFEAQQQAQDAASQQTLQLGEAYLAGNREREGVMVTESGLQYEIVHDEAGETASASDSVTVKYTGTFIDGGEFDSSGDNPVTFRLQQVITGWTEGLQLMSVGDKFRFHIHPNLAYGTGGVGRIPPNSVLIFDVELLKIN